MAIEVLMPSMPAFARSGRVARWLVSVGDVVRPGDVLALIETDTATMEVEAVDAGRVVRILVREGGVVGGVDTPLAMIEAHDDIGYRGSDVADAGRHGREPARRVKASPLARKRARAARLAISDLHGSGPGGRIIARDVSAGRVREGLAGERAGRPDRSGQRGLQTSMIAMRTQRDGAPDNLRLAHRMQGLSEAIYGGSLAGDEIDEATLVREAYAPGSYVAMAHDPYRRVLGGRLDRAHARVPQLTLGTDVDVDELHRVLARLNLGASKGGRQPLSLSVSDVLVKAMGLALRQVSEANVSYTRSAMLHHGVVDVAVGLLPDQDGDAAIGVAGGQWGVAAAVIAHADLKSLSEISQELRALRAMAAAGQLDPATCLGGVSTIYDFSGSIVHGCEVMVVPPQSSVLVMGACQTRALAVDGVVVMHKFARLSLNVDQRAIDMGCASRLLGAVRSFLEDPMRMLV